VSLGNKGPEAISTSTWSFAGHWDDSVDILDGSPISTTVGKTELDEEGGDRA
jgi:hypothetical protein